jgi:tagatose-1,6-bisphosphate aldolase non-catalytic subunit AgaZ/GatZ
MFMFQLVAHLSNVPHVRREVHPTNGQAEVLLDSIVSEGFQIMNVMDVLFFSIHNSP